MAKKILFVGESWNVTVMEVKGFNSFMTSKYETGLGYIDKAIENSGYEFDYMPSHIAQDNFPFELDGLRNYECIILSDVGADTLLIPSRTFANGVKYPNRCQLIKDYVCEGGSLLMFGGYMTFSGIGGQGKWWSTPVQDILPVNLLPFDDRMEHCEGVIAVIEDPDHPIVNGLPDIWPALLGYNKCNLKEGAELVATICKDPLIACWRYGKGRTAIFSSDCALHWASPEFLTWKYFDTLIKNILNYIC